ncbi:hypothetical protein GGR95_002478 [Sulfitobacter undariae]|uniref:Uncharacterized protein n=1 Tax=Sulfitobacter undariae TaxID=1563671 RepID=A0A7W6EBQ7_9RHOB|nr:hypothetical protein [Sulfitobacter undariae]
MRFLNIEEEALKIVFTQVELGPRNVSRSFCALGGQTERLALRLDQKRVPWLSWLKILKVNVGRSGEGKLF